MLIGYILLISFLCLFVFLANYTYKQKDPFKGIDLEAKEDEQQLAKMQTSSLFRRQLVMSTPRKLLTVQKSLFFLNRELKIIENSEEGFTSIILKKRMNFLYFVSGIIISYLCAPVGLTLILYSLIYPVLIADLMPPKLRITAQVGISKKPLFSGFFKGLERLRPQNPLSMFGGFVEALQIVPPFSLAASFPMGIYLGLAIVQRILEGHVKFDGFLIFPIYLALPIITGRIFGKVCGALSGILGFLCLLTVMFPFPAFDIFSDYPEVATSLSSTVIYGIFFGSGGKGLFQNIMTQTISVALVLSLMGFVSGFLSKSRFKDYLSPFSAVLWLVVVAAFKPANLCSLDLYAQIAISMCWVVIIVNLLGDKYENWVNRHDFIKESFQYSNS